MRELAQARAQLSSSLRAQSIEGCSRTCRQYPDASHRIVASEVLRFWLRERLSAKKIQARVTRF
jgi:hypothetical protein